MYSLKLHETKHIEKLNNAVKKLVYKFTEFYGKLEANNMIVAIDSSLITEPKRRKNPSIKIWMSSSIMSYSSYFRAYYFSESRNMPIWKLYGSISVEANFHL